MKILIEDLNNEEDTTYGRWIREDDGDRYIGWYCSNCGYPVLEIENTCPGCKAKMI